MNSAPHTLELFFGLDGTDGKTPKELVDAVRSAVTRQLAEAATTAAAVKAFAGKTVSETQLALSASEVIGFFRRAMSDLSIPQLLGSAWSKYAALRKYTNTRDYPPDKLYTEAFFKQTVTSTHKPFVELKVGGVKVATVVFAVEVKVTFEEVSLSIQDGRIMAAGTGKVMASGSVKCEDVEVLKRKLGQLELPGRIAFQDGIPIGFQSGRDSGQPSLDRGH
jgi:hypothetical protein